MADVAAHHKPCQILILTEGRKVASLTLYSHKPLTLFTPTHQIIGCEQKGVIELKGLK